MASNSQMMTARPNGDAPIFELIFNSISEGVFTTDRSCRVTSFNQAAEKISGFSRAQAIGRYCFDIFRTDICHRQCPLRNTLKKGMPISNVRVDILSRDGLKIPISVSTSILRDEQGDITGAVEIFRDLSTLEGLRKQLNEPQTFENLVSRNAEMHSIFEILPDVAQSECSVLIQGPSGSGKELLSRSIHNLSPREKAPYIRVNCAALPANLLESELFGYVRGAFTDARRDKPGRFALADGGTILLDEIGDMPITLQAKLLRVLQEGEVQPLGSTQTLSVDVRTVASSNRDLKQMVEEKTFREDLYYRLNVITVDIPPLARRREDVPLLIDHFINKLRAKTGKGIRSVRDDVFARLMAYDYPGNVRELENMIEHAFVLCKGETIELCDLPRDLFANSSSPASSPSGHSFLDGAERRILEEAIAKHEGNKTRIAAELGIHRATLWRKLKKYGF